MFRYAQRDKEDLKLTVADVEEYAKRAKAQYAAIRKLAQLGVAAKGIEEFKLAWKYR